MSKARDIADLVSAGGILADGAIATTEITGVTSTSAELNILDGVTSTAAELNALDGITATVTELNYTDGVTSAIQTQIDTKSPTASPTFTGTLAAPTINASTALQIGGTAITSTAAELNILDGVTATTAELNFVDGVTSSIQTQINAISPDPTLGTLTKSFANGESSVITLSSTVSPTAIVAVTKEVSQIGVSSKGGWDVASDAANYELYNQAPATSLSLSSASADGTATLGTGSFASADVGKRIFTSDGGEGILTATDGSYNLVSAFGATTYTSGNWSLSGLDVDATNGITIVSKQTINPFDMSNVSYSNNFLDVSSYDTQPMSVHLKPDGTKLYFTGAQGNDIHEFNLSTAYELSTASFVAVKTFNSAANASFTPGFVTGFVFSPNGDKLIVLDDSGNYLYEYDLSTAWDISTISYVRRFATTFESGVNSLFMNSSGTRLMVGGSVSNDITRVALGTPYSLISTSVSGGVGSVASQTSDPDGLSFNSDGTKMFVMGRPEGKVFQYTLSTGFSPNTLSYDGVSFDISSQNTTPEDIYISTSGKRMYTICQGTDKIYQYNIGSEIQPTAQYLPALTSTSGQIDSQYWTDINSMTADDADNDGQVYYAVSTDDRTTWSIAKASDGVRPIVRNNGGTWQYNSNATYGSTTYTNGTTNDEFATIAQAMTVAANQMDKAQIDAVTDGSHFTLGNTLDLAIIPYLASTGTAPTSDGVSINYDAAALNKGAILGTDYDYDVPATNKVRITSNAAQNLKVRIV